MEIKNHASKLVKPSTPTPSTFRSYNISVFDEQVVNINTNLILYYAAPQNNKHVNIFSQLEISLSKTLTDFYPFAGRYMRHASLVDCSDQGALYVQAKANFQLSEFLGLAWELKLNMLQDLLPCDFGEAGEIDDPIFSVKVTTFECGGVVIGMSFSHKVSDMSTMCTFINNWSTRTRSQQIVDKELELGKYYLDYSLANRFPKRGLIDNSPRFPRSRIEMKNQVQKFIFKRNAISKIREKLNIIEDSRPSKVQLIVALLWKALVGIDKANDGQSKISYVSQVVNMRNKVVPKLADNSFGNFVTLAFGRIKPDKRDNIVNLQGFLKLLHESIKEIDSTCAGLMTHGDKEYELLFKRLTKNTQDSTNNDVNWYIFTSWCRFSFYRADFGWGKPIWRSPGKFPGQNLVTIMDDEEGEGVEAWVHLDEKRICQLEQDPDIKAYAI